MTEWLAGLQSMPFPLLSAIVATPLLGALILVFLDDAHQTAVRWVTLLSAMLSFAGTIWVFKIVMGLERLGLEGAGYAGWNLAERYPIVPSLNIDYYVAADGWSAVLMLLTGLIIVTGVFASWNMVDRQREFFIFLLVLVAGVYGVFVAQDLFVFFLFYEIAVLPMYLLIGIWGSSNKVAEAGPFRWAFRLLDVGGKEYAAMKLTLMLLAGSAFILAAMLAMYWEAGGTFDMQHMASDQVSFSFTTQVIAFPLLWIGFGTLGGLFPFHTWSPDGHASAPTAVSMLHAGVLMKLGAFGVIRVGMMLLPDGAYEWAFIVGTVAVINIVWGAFCAMSQRDLKYIIAYSSVSHMGVVLLGAATLEINGWNGAIFQMFAHGVMTGMFFALVGLIYERTHDRWIPNMGGFGTIMPFAAGFFTLACMSSLGLPGTAGFVAEFLVFVAAWESHHWWWAVAGGIGAFVTAVYVLRAVRLIFLGEGPPQKFADLPDATGTEHVALWALAAAIVVFGFWPRLLLDPIDGATSAWVQELDEAKAQGPAPQIPGQARDSKPDSAELHLGEAL